MIKRIKIAENENKEKESRESVIRSKEDLIYI